MRRWVEGLTGGIAAGATLFLVGAAFHLMIPVVAPNIPPQFADSPLLYRPWSGWTGTYMLIHPFVYGFVFAAVFLGLRHWANFLPGVQGGLIYGAGVFVVGSLPVFLLAFASFQMSPEVALAWIAQSLAQYAIAGMAIGCVHDGVMLRVCTHLAAPADRMWELLMRKDSFLFVTRGLMSYSGTDQWPTRLFTEGATLTTRVRLLGLGPATPHEVHIVQVNAAQGQIETRESGRLVRSWNHRMSVQPLSEQACLYTDCIELRAGLLTPLVWLFATVFYRYRQRRWQQLLKLASPSTATSASSDTAR